ncbi:MAG: LytR family transcriptional protein [Chloroflexi bacterium]|nr:MAG: LytR family transcriptional protein [Chloroflexota bacterium]MBA4375893.1 hypothetical protein [Anaerolinea sp.]
MLHMMDQNNDNLNQNPEDRSSGKNRMGLPEQFDPAHYDAVVKAYSTSWPKQEIPQNITSPGRIDLPIHTKKKAPSLCWWMLIAIVIFFFFTPFRVTILALGIDRPPAGTWQGRSDTMILTTLPPVLPQLSMLSIPRDLWVTVPGHYENRINTAHYFAEINEPGTGMKAATDVVELNFGIKVDYVIRIKFDGFIKIVDAMGGVTIDLPMDMSGMTAGKHHLNGAQALRFVRDRTGSDDFFRQQRGQLFISSALKETLNPLKWARLPIVFTATAQAIDTNLPVWLWPRVGYGVLFSALKGFDAQTLDREMITPWATDQGAQVLLPNWDKMNPLVDGLFK